MARVRKPYVLVRRTLPSNKIVWYYRLASDPQGSLRSTGILATQNNRQDAELYVEQIIGTAGITTFAAFAKGFFKLDSRFMIRNQMKNRAMRPANARQRQCHLDKWLIPRFGHLPLNQIRGVDFEDCQADFCH